MGVAMLNLKKIREDKKDDEMIEAINTYWYRYKEQDCFNEFFRGHALISSLIFFKLSIATPILKYEPSSSLNSVSSTAAI